MWRGSHHMHNILDLDVSPKTSIAYVAWLVPQHANLVIITCDIAPEIWAWDLGVEHTSVWLKFLSLFYLAYPSMLTSAMMVQRDINRLDVISYISFSLSLSIYIRIYIYVYIYIYIARPGKPVHHPLAPLSSETRRA